jgi:hypothetical protein
MARRHDQLEAERPQQPAWEYYTAENRSLERILMKIPKQPELPALSPFQTVTVSGNDLDRAISQIEGRAGVILSATVKNAHYRLCVRLPLGERLEKIVNQTEPQTL